MAATGRVATEATAVVQVEMKQYKPQRVPMIWISTLVCPDAKTVFEVVLRSHIGCLARNRKW